MTKTIESVTVLKTINGKIWNYDLLVDDEKIHIEAEKSLTLEELDSLIPNKNN